FVETVGIGAKEELVVAGPAERLGNPIEDGKAARPGGGRGVREVNRVSNRNQIELAVPGDGEGAERFGRTVGDDYGVVEREAGGVGEDVAVQHFQSASGDGNLGGGVDAAADLEFAAGDGGGTGVGV